MRIQKLRSVFTLVFLAGLTSMASAGDDYYGCSSNECFHPGGARQKYKFGKNWPPYARPVGCKEPYMHKYHRAHYWPYPYMCDDRSVIRQVVQQQSDNGWMNYTTLYDYHFDASTQELNQAGRLKLQWIALYSPERYRTAYVAASLDPRDSEIRLANTTSLIATICGSEDAAPPVMLRRAQSIGTPAEEVYLIRGAYLLSTPAPRLPYQAYGADAPEAE